MPRYRRLPIEVEAVQWFPGVDIPGVIHEEDSKEAFLETLEGIMMFSAGDYVVTGIAGERYAIREDIFEQSYEKV